MSDSPEDKFLEETLKFGESITDGEWQDFDKKYAARLRAIIRLCAGMMVMSHTSPKASVTILKEMEERFGDTPPVSLLMDFGTIMYAFAEDMGGDDKDDAETLSRFIQLMMVAETAAEKFLHERVAEIATNKAFGDLDLSRLADKPTPGAERLAKRLMELLDEAD